MRPIWHFPVVSVLFIGVMCAVGGCPVCVDGVFSYHLEVTLVDESGQPMADTLVAVVARAFFSPEEEDPSWTGFVWTDLAGHVSTTAYSSLSWGRCWLAGIQPPPSPPVPPNPETLYLWLQESSGEWVRHELRIEEEDIVDQEPAELWIDLGQVTITPDNAARVSEVFGVD